MDTPSHRQARAQVRLFDAGGSSLPVGTDVRVTQTRQAFRFGANAFAIKPADASPEQVEHQRLYAALFNFATLPFYWGRYEPMQGEPQRDRLSALAHWCRERDIQPKGHPLCWHEVWPAWCQDIAQTEALQWARIHREIRDFAGLVDVWDVVNEAVVMPNFTRTGSPLITRSQQIGQVELIRRAFAAATAAGVPDLALLLNDYDVSPAYEDLIARCLDGGVPIDVIGIQSHMHAGYWGAEKLWEVCERFARFGKPLHFTELTILSGPQKENQRWGGERYTDWHSTPEHEEQQARQVEELYRLLFAHGAVEAVTWWDFADGGAWLGAPAGLLRKDLSPKPAYGALLRLVNDEWWSGPRTLVTDAAGAIAVTGFKGEYQLEAAGQKAVFSLNGDLPSGVGNLALE